MIDENTMINWEMSLLPAIVKEEDREGGGVVKADIYIYVYISVYVYICIYVCVCSMIHTYTVYVF